MHFHHITTLQLVITAMLLLPLQALASWKQMPLGYTWTGEQSPTEEDYNNLLKGEVYDIQRGLDGKRFTYSGIYKTGDKYTNKEIMKIRKSKTNNPTLAPDLCASFCDIIAHYQKGNRHLLEKTYKYPDKIAAAHFYTNKDAARDIPIPLMYKESDDSDSFQSQIIKEDSPEELEIKPSDSWIAIYRGNVIAPKNMTFRFLGAATDYLSVTFNGQQVLETGTELPAYTKGNGLKDKAHKISTTSEYQDAIKSGTERNHRDYILMKYKRTEDSNKDFGGVTGGTPITVTKGTVYPIEIMIAYMAKPKTYIHYYFYLMTLEVTQNNDSKPVLFRTKNHPVIKSPAFNPLLERGPIYDDTRENDIWRVASKKNVNKTKKIKKRSSRCKKRKHTSSE